MIVDAHTYSTLKNYKEQGALLIIGDEVVQDIRTEGFDYEDDIDGCDFLVYSVHGWCEGYSFGDDVDIKVFMPVKI